jgi:Cu/Zn superoxide dismutase
LIWIKAAAQDASRIKKSSHEAQAMNMKLLPTSIAVALAGVFAVAGSTLAASAHNHSDSVYVAHLMPLNTQATGTQTTGEARFEVKGNQLVITVKVKGAPPGITHWQHFHGFKDNRAATCATQADDVNGDGIVDLIETGKASGTTMVPFDNAPAAMDVAHGTYPKASTNGTYSYRQVVPLKVLSAAFGKAFDGQSLDLDHRVVYIHGVPSTTKLPSTVASLGPIPASVTLPIACGKIERVGR